MNGENRRFFTNEPLAMGKQADIEEDGRMGIQFIKEGNRILIGLDLELTDNRWVEGVNLHILIVPPEGIGRHRPTTWSWSWISVVYGEGHREIDAPPQIMPFMHSLSLTLVTPRCLPSLLLVTFLPNFLSMASRGSQSQGGYSIVKLKSMCKQKYSTTLSRITKMSQNFINFFS